MKISAHLHNFRFRLPVLHIRILSNCYWNKYNNHSISQFFKNLFLEGICYSAQLGVAASASATTLRTPTTEIRST